jgi:glycosyltransferase involved in cell wall biosynthesis
MNKLSIITPILKIDRNFKKLLTSILKLEGRNFNFIVVAKYDLIKDLKELVRKKNFIHIINEVQPKGLYRAFNLALKSKYCNDFYMVLGQDDLIINKSLIQEVEKEINISDDKIADIFTLNVISNIIYKQKIPSFKRESHIRNFFRNMNYFFSNHCGGMIIKKKLHNKYGYYNENYRIASDYNFLRKVKNKIFIKRTKILSARLGENGISSKEILLSLFERYLIDLKFSSKFNMFVFLKFFFSLYKQTKIFYKKKFNRTFF